MASTDCARKARAPDARRRRSASACFIGCLPFYGFHLLLCWIVGTLFRLNRLKVYLAANISNPFVAPWLLFAELQAGAWFRHGAFQPISVSAIRTAGFGALGLDLLVGSLLVGGVLAVIAGGATYGTLRALGPATRRSWNWCAGRPIAT